MSICDFLVKICEVWSSWNVNDTKMLIAFMPFVAWLLYKKQYDKIERYVVTITLCLIFHIALKGTLKIPHPVHTNTFAFPSGRVYMFMAIIVALCMELMNKKKALILSLSLTILESVLVCVNNHHTIIDAVGGFVICGIQLLAIYFAYSKIGTELLLKVCVMAPYVVISLLYTSAPEYITKHRDRFVCYSLVCLAIYLFKRYRQKRNQHSAH